jgi:putative hydrolase of the HAD superfamily
MSEISTVLWDVGGVLLTNGWDHQGRASVLERFNVDRVQFEERHPEANDLWEKGLIPVDEYLHRTVFWEPRNFTPNEFLDAMKAESRLLPNTAIEVLESIAASQELDLGILNNEARELNDYRIETFGLHAYFDFFFSSCYVAQRKPGERIYRLALEVLQCEPGEVIFIDDRAENAAAAASQGINAIHYEGPAQLVNALARYGVEVETD